MTTIFGSQDFVYDGHQCIVMPFIDGGTLQSELPNGHCLSEIWARYFFQQLICSVLYLAQQVIVLCCEMLLILNLLLFQSFQALLVAYIGNIHYQYLQ